MAHNRKSVRRELHEERPLFYRVCSRVSLGPLEVQLKKANSACFVNDEQVLHPIYE